MLRCGGWVVIQGLYSWLVGNDSFLIQKSFLVSGCPNTHVVHNHSTDAVHDILIDNCNDEDSGDWLVAEEAVKEAQKMDTQVIINLGCSKKIKGLRMKNIKKENGGTKGFSVYVSDESPEGPWKLILSDKFVEETNIGCASMQTFDKLE